MIICLENLLDFFLSGRLRQVLLFQVDLLDRGSYISTHVLLRPSLLNELRKRSNVWLCSDFIAFLQQNSIIQEHEC